MTAYKDALEAIQRGETVTQPDYITAADTLNMANGNRTFMESVGDAAEDIPKFIAASVISGANQLYNIPADVGNLFGGEYETSDTGEVISSLDSNLGKFYEEHKEGVDLVGFLASSLVPGTLGVKVLNAGQKSLRTAINAKKFGENTGKALGLLAPDKASWIAKATKEAATNSSVASLNNTNAMRAVMAGVGQNGLEALAFEVAVTATMFNSPVMENQDFGDFLSNVAWGAGVFGVVGGVVDAAKLNSKLKLTANTAALEARPWQFIPEQASASTSYEKIAMDFETLHNIPNVPEGLDVARAEFLRQAGDTTRTKLEQRVRTEMGKLAGGDEEVAQTLFNAFRGTSKETKQSAMIGLVETGRVTSPSTVERLANKVTSGKASLAEIDAFAETTKSVAYAKTWGEEVGRVTPDSPTITSVVDTLHTGQQIKVSKRSGVTAGKTKYKMNLKDAPKYSVLEVANAVEADARYIWVSQLDDLTPSLKNPLQVNVNDIPMMEKVVTDLVDTGKDGLLEHVKFVGLKEGEAVGADVTEFLYTRKVELANKLLTVKRPAGAKPYNQEEIAAIVNIKASALNGELLRDSAREFNRKDMLAMQDHAATYTDEMIKRGLKREGTAPVDIWNIPQHVKMTYDSKPFEGVNNFVTENMVIIKEQQKLYQEGTSRASAGILGEDYTRFEDITSGRVMEGAVPSGAGANYISAASSNYGTLAASSEYLGNVTAGVIQKFKDRTAEALTPLLHKLGNSQKASIEWSTLNARVRSIEGEYGLNAAGDALEPLLLLRWRKDAAEAVESGLQPPKRPDLPNPAMEASIPIKNQETRNLMRAHIELNGKRTGDLASLRSAQGQQYNRSPDVFYPIPVNPQDFPHFAMVIDQSITSGNHSKTLYASSAKELAEMTSKLKSNPQLKILTKQEAENHYKSIGQWDYEKTLSNNYLDVEAHRKGVSAPHLVTTDPKKIVDDMLAWHMQRETGLVREAVSAKYEVQFEELKRLGDEYSNIGTSQFTDINLLKFSGDAVKNPYRDYIKTALAIKKTADYPWHTNISKLVDEKFSQMYKKVTELTATGSKADLEKVNLALKEAGYKGAAYDESMEIFANASPAKGVLSATVQKANALMATVVLRWDALNAVNNAVSANVLLGAETKAVTRAISKGDTNAVGQLAALTRIKVPGTEETIFSAQKLIANSIKKFNRQGDDFTFYKENGFMSSISSQYADNLDDLAFKGTESATSWNTRLDNLHNRLRAAGDKGEQLTGNKLAEEFNRFVAADVMKQMTDVAIKNGLMSPKEQLAYINTFVNRTQGNYLASQRPMMFHGPIGQAVGLFQTYQFNLLQQLFRHVGEGHGKDAMTLLGLQGTIHGMNGMPAFNAVNTNLIGNASGNTEHTDAYDAVYGIVGKEAGDWLTYGMASNAMGLLHPDLKVNLYTRGDINPRHLTIVPTDPSQVPIIQATGKVFANIFNTAKQIGQGADVSTALLQGLEHNGLSRPLAGLAQTLEGFNNPEYASYSTSKRGNVIAANDLLSLTNLTRMVGGKPLDEAIAIDATYRYKTYALKDSRQRTSLGQAIKTTMQAGNDPTQEQIEDFAGSYAEAGGKQEDFAGWMTQLYKTANLSQSNSIQQSLSSPFSQSMQTIMGGRELRDFSSPVPPSTSE